MTVTVTEPTGPAKGGVVIVHEGFGVTGYILDVARRFADAGWVAAVPHLYHRTGDPVFAYDVDHAEIIPHASAMTGEGILADVDAALAELASRGVSAEHVGVVGFCQGGAIAMMVATERTIGAAVTFYGGGIAGGSFGVGPLVDLVGSVRAPWLGLYGERDEWIPLEEIGQLEQAAPSASQPTKLIRYPAGGHGFHCDARSSYERDSAEAAWQQALAWLDSYVARSPVATS
jgi:carboxymethylenebutenolidase